MKINHRILVVLLVLIVFICSSCNFKNSEKNTGLADNNAELNEIKANSGEIIEAIKTECVSDNEYLLHMFSDKEDLYCVKTTFQQVMTISNVENDNETLISMEDLQYGIDLDYRIFVNDDSWFIVNNPNYGNNNGVYLIDRSENNTIDYVSTEDKKIIDTSVSESGQMLLLCSKTDISKKQNTIVICNGSCFERTIDVENVLSKGKNYDVMCICTDKKDNIYIAYDMVNEKHIAKMSSKGELLFDNTISNMWGNRFDLLLCENGDLLFCGSDALTTLINRISADTGENKDYYQCDKPGCDIVGMMPDNTLLIRDEKNLYTFSLDENDVTGEPIPASRDSAYNIFDGNLIEARKNNIYENLIVKYSHDSLTELNSVSLGMSDILLVENNSEGEICYLEYAGNEYYLVVSDINGKEMSKKKIDTNGLFISDMALDETGNIYVLLDDDVECKSFVKKYDEGFNCVSETEIADSKGSYSIDIYHGNLYIQYYSLKENEMIYEPVYLDENHSLISDEYKIEKIYRQTTDDVIFLSSTGSVIKFSAEEGVYKELFNKSDLPVVAADQIDEVVYFYDNLQLVKSGNVLYKIIIADPNNKDVLKIASDNKMISLDIYIGKFRENHPDILIKRIDYSDMTAEEINIDLASGNIPDVVITEGMLDLNIFESKDLLVNLSEYVDDENYYTNVFHACSGDNTKITQIIPSFKLITAVGKQENFGDETGWTFDEFINDKKISFFNTNQAMWSAEWIVMLQCSEFINMNEKKVEFTDTFDDYLEFMRGNVPLISESDIEYEAVDKAAEDDKYDRRFLDDKCTLDIIQLSDVRDIYRLRYAYINEPFVFKGLPSEKSNGTYVDPTMRICMLETCKNKKNAWEFMKLFLSDDEQNKLAEHGGVLPVSKKALEKMFEYYSEDVVYIAGEPKEIDASDKELRKQFYDLIDSITVSVRYDKKINGVISEELGEFFASDKKANETLNSIKHKISLYLSEIG